MVCGAECKACASIPSMHPYRRDSPEPQSPSQTCDRLHPGPSMLPSACCRPSSSAGQSACQACRQPPARICCIRALQDMQHTLRQGAQGKIFEQQLHPFASLGDMTEALRKVLGGKNSLVRAWMMKAWAGACHITSSQQNTKTPVFAHTKTRNVSRQDLISIH